MTRPAFASVRDWCAISGMGQRATYAAIRRGDLVAKCPERRKLLIDVEAGLVWMRGLPAVVAEDIRQCGAKCGEME
jgi:hypothetical protein